MHGVTADCPTVGRRDREASAVWSVISQEDGRRDKYDWTRLACVVLRSCDPTGQLLGPSSFVSSIMCAASVVSLLQPVIYQCSKLCEMILVPPSIAPALGTLVEHRGHSDVPATHSEEGIRRTTRQCDVTTTVANVGFGSSYLRLFMTVWLSIFRRSHLVRRGERDASIASQGTREIVDRSQSSQKNTAARASYSCRRAYRWVKVKFRAY